jgi:hypothetical protein
MVAALAEEHHLPFRRRKHQRREDHWKREQGDPRTLATALANTLRCPLERREACCERMNTTKERGQELVKPDLD